MNHSLILFVCLFVGWLVGWFVCLFVCLFVFIHFIHLESRVLNLISIDNLSQLSYDGRQRLQFVFHFHPGAHHFSGSFFSTPAQTPIFQPPQNFFFAPGHVLSRVSISNRFFFPT